MVIAEMARMHLDAGVENLVDEQFQFLNQFFPQTNNMVSGACWADDLKSQGLEVMAGWHFINQVYNPDNVSITYKNWPMQKINVATAITKLDKTMAPNKPHRRGIEKANEKVEAALRNGTEPELNQLIKAYAVANIVHFIGDVHQPLHATERFNERFPNGDEGGNLIHVNWAGKVWPLHFIWDSICAQYTTEPPRPPSYQNYEWVKSLTYEFMNNFSVPEEMKKTYNSTIMAEESFEAAVKFAYANNTITEGQNLTQAYIDQCKWVAGYRISYAGFRLATELNHIFGTLKDAPVARVVQRIVETKKSFGSGFQQKN